MISPAAATLLAAGGVVLAAAICLALHASRRADRRRHADTVRDAIAGMLGALGAESPERALLRELSVLLAEQDGKAVALEAQLRELFPDRVRAEPDCPAGRLAALTELTWDLRPKAGAVPEIEARVMEMLAEEEPHAVVSSFVAGNFDFSRDALARAQFIMAGDHADRAADSLVLRSALALYALDIETAAIDMSVAQPDRRNAGPRAARSARQLAAHVFRSGIRNLPDTSGETNSGSPRPADGPASRRRSARGGQTTGSPVQLRMQDVFDLAPGSPWLASGRAYLPLFGFVVSDLRDLVALDDAWAALLAAARQVPEDSPAARPSSEDSARHLAGDSVAAHRGGRRPSLLPGLDGPPGGVIQALIGPKVTGIVDGRGLAWSMSECNTELVELLARADSATLRLFAEVADGLEAEFETYLATMGHVPRLDTVGRGMLAQIAADLEESARRHVRLAYALVAEAEALGQLSPVSGEKPNTGGDAATTRSPDAGRLLAAVTAADVAITASREALEGGACLKAACDVLSARIPMSPSGLPGHGLYGDLLAQARPLAILAAAHRIAVADWAALALHAYFHSCQAAAVMIANRLGVYQHEHEQIILAANASVTGLQRAGSR